MKCPYCGHSKHKVVDSRDSRDGTAIRRRRECLDCGRRMTTYEQVELTPLMVLKKDGSRERFDRAKLMDGLLRACEKRPVTGPQLEAICDDVQMLAQDQGEREINSQQIGERVMDQLRDIDEVAYVRFASVYRHFRDVNAFMDELKGLLGSQS